MSAMTAEDFVDLYMNLQVGSTTVSLNKYAIGADYSSPKAKARGAVQWAAKQKGLAPDPNVFSRATNGKVSPHDCEHILTMALQSGAVKEGGLQAWADQNLGVDCTGFAVAYYSELGMIDINRYNGGASCFALLNGAVNNHDPSDDGPLLWSLDDVAVDDMILWMTEAKTETRTPGHISIIYDIDTDRGILSCGESNGANDGQGHFGPKTTERSWVGEQKNGNRHFIQLGKSDQVIIVRPPPRFG
jgi:hypothetical protein